MYRVNQKVVFIVKNPYPHPDMFRISINLKVPEYGEIYTIKEIIICPKYKEPIVVFKELCLGYNINTGQEYGVGYECIRPIDYLYGKTIAEEIEQEINEENLVHYE